MTIGIWVQPAFTGYYKYKEHGEGGNLNNIYAYLDDNHYNYGKSNIYYNSNINDKKNIAITTYTFIIVIVVTTSHLLIHSTFHHA